jgi:hypothetical protein
VSSRSKPADNVPDTPLESDPRWQLVQRVVASQHLVKSARLQELLLYVCRCALEDRGSEISEQRIGERVFQRPPGYNPNDDNIVRAQARLLRQKLQAYFDSDGNAEPLILTIPKGAYSPEFVERPDDLPATPPPPARLGWVTPRVHGLLALIAALVVGVVVLAWLLAQSKQQRAQSVTARPPSLNALWSQLFGENMTTTVIVPDATEAMLQEATKQPVDLATYLRRSPNPENEKLRQIENTLKGFSIRRYTTFDGVSTAVKITQLAGQFPGRLAVRYARDMTLREFSPGNIVLIGRPATNLWGEMFENKLNFGIYSDLQRDIAICRNRAPQHGEEAEYLPIENGPKRTVYAAVAFVPNLNDGGNVLMISGMSSGAQEIAAEFVTNEKLLNTFANKIWKPGHRLSHFEILIRTITLAGVPQEPEVIAYRVLER